MANYSEQVIPIEKIVDLLPVAHWPERIGEYQEAISDGAQFPPISVLSFFGRYYITDGHKRFSALKGLLRSHVISE